MSKSISIVMPYYNRVEQLRLTLLTIQKYTHLRNVEVIILDDCSESSQAAKHAIGNVDLNIKLIEYTKAERTWSNPCHVFNMGFKQATGEIVIIQNPECFHYGDIIGHVLENVNDANYVVYSCKNIKAGQFEDLKNKNPQAFEKTMQVLKNSSSSWYNHPVYNPKCYHFLSAITKKNLDNLGGFDERYANGHSFDDDEFLERIKRSPFEIVNVSPDICFCVHQWHPCTHPSDGNKDEGWKRNHRLFVNVTSKETGWKANDP